MPVTTVSEAEDGLVLLRDGEAEDAEAHLVEGLLAQEHIGRCLEAATLQRITDEWVPEAVVVRAAHGQGVPEVHVGEVRDGTVEEVAALPVEVPLRSLD